MPKPTPGSFFEYFQKYIDQVTETELMPALQNQLPAIKDFLSGITEEQSAFAYAEGKWTIKEVLQHMIDTERIFAYRALCFARKEAASLPGFEEKDYAANSGTNDRSWQSLSEEMVLLRESTIQLFASFPPGSFDHSGIASQNPITVLAIGFILPGHVTHHMRVIAERYLQESPGQ